MPHIPKFPPDLDEWLPPPPGEGPPLPKFLLNPWLGPEERISIEEEAGRWATSRAEAMVPQSFGPEAVRTLASRFWENLRIRYGIAPSPPPPAPPRRRRAA